MMVVIVASDRGLCGGFNSALFKRVKKEIDEEMSQDINAQIVTIGNKARDWISFKLGKEAIIKH